MFFANPDMRQLAKHSALQLVLSNVRLILHNLEHHKPTRFPHFDLTIIPDCYLVSSYRYTL